MPQAHPQVRVDLEELVSDEVVAQLRDGRADVGVFVQGPDTAWT
jgi:DNA-binding transcriptional LysR family regulator